MSSYRLNSIWEMVRGCSSFRSCYICWTDRCCWLSTPQKKQKYAPFILSNETVLIYFEMFVTFLCLHLLLCHSNPTDQDEAQNTIIRLLLHMNNPSNNAAEERPINRDRCERMSVLWTMSWLIISPQIVKSKENNLFKVRCLFWRFCGILMASLRPPTWFMSMAVHVQGRDVCFHGNGVPSHNCRGSQRVKHLSNSLVTFFFCFTLLSWP